MPSIINAALSGGLISTADTSGELRLQTASTTALTITSAQNVGIGTTSPLTKLDFGPVSNNIQIISVRQNGNNRAGLGINSDYGLRVTGPSDATATISFGSISVSDGSTFTERGRFTTGGYFKASNNGTYNNSGGSNHEFYNSANAETLIVRNANASFASEALIVSADRNTTNNSYYFLRLNVPGVANRLLIADSGSISTAGSVQLGDAGAPPTSGVGVKFPATQSASSDANTLDDYEEGTWSPTLTASSGSATYSGLNAGTYQKIGNRVNCFALLQLASTSLSGQLFVGGLPFTSNSDASFSRTPVCIGRVTSWNSAPIGGAIVGAATTSFEIYKESSSNNMTDSIGSDATSASAIYFSVSYMAQN
jgi:hypothetical protein